MGCWRGEGGGRGSTTNIWNLEKKTKHNCCYTGRRKALTWTAVDSLKPPHPIKVKQTSSPLGFQAVWDVPCHFSLFNVTRTSLDWNSGRELEKLNFTFHSKKQNNSVLCPMMNCSIYFFFFFFCTFLLHCPSLVSNRPIFVLCVTRVVCFLRDNDVDSETSRVLLNIWNDSLKEFKPQQ